MTSDPGRAYRRLLRVCPPGPRREELLATLLDAGRRHPSVREDGDLQGPAGVVAVQRIPE
ncbi:hypothetical protein [Actinoplanes sp. RD1]|uniref:hypothetical protein n=1 Tax=Actinoplanes sp. RD1 TaxID=3064538 RepID=UPI002741E646|nr:hypothetical protein [Actinoplanes sp. RD1]